MKTLKLVFKDKPNGIVEVYLESDDDPSGSDLTPAEDLAISAFDFVLNGADQDEMLRSIDPPQGKELN